MRGVLTNGSRDPILSMHRHDSPDRIRSLELDAAQLVGETFDLLCVHPAGTQSNCLCDHFLLPCCPFAHRFTKGLRVNGGSRSTPSNQWGIIVVSGTLAIQLLDDVSAAAHRARKLLDQSLFSTLVIDVRLHETPAHVGLRQLY